VDDRDPHVNAGYAQGVVEASTLTLTALDVMTCCDFFKEELRGLDAMIMVLGRTREEILATLKVSHDQQMCVVGM
jgi:hypothetical protein